jgi:hypothetical protein
MKLSVPTTQKGRREAVHALLRGDTVKAVSRVVLIAGALLALVAGIAVEARSAPRAEAALGRCDRPYAESSPWNVPIGRNANYDSRSRTYAANLGERLSSDPTQYTYPVYEVAPGTPRERVALSGLYSNVTGGGRRLDRQSDATISLPIPNDARASAGSDSSIVIVDRRTGDEWGIWRLTRDSGGWTGTNGYHYNIRWSAVPPSGFGSRGSGLPYLAGLVRPCEIARGRIDHALAFAYDFPTAQVVYPATKSDGKGSPGSDVPEGARLQLNPSLSRRQIRRWGCKGACLTIARALQRYGMYVIDNSGRPKIMLEDEGTARWRGIVSAKTVEPIPLNAFRVLTLSCVVPDARGRTLAVARTLVRLAQCRLARVRTVRRSGASARVVSQRPAPGTRAAAVTLFVGR